MKINNNNFIFSIILNYFLIIKNVQSYGEPNLNGNPTWYERSNLILVNAVRIAPKEYQNKYTMFGDQDVLSPSIYPSVPPVFYEYTLGLSALAHATDMSENGCFSHESCDGTDVDSRINDYYQCHPIHGENIAAGYDSPLITNNQWVCDDGGNDPYSNPTCASDASGSDGHRANIMNPNFVALGIGYAFTSDSTYHSYWTQDFGAATCFNTSNLIIHSGSHLYLEDKQIKFMVDWYDKDEPTVAYIVINGKPNKLTLDIGTKSKGIYSISLPKFDKNKDVADKAKSVASKLLQVDDCRDYYFYFEKSVTVKTTNTSIQMTDKGNVTVTSFSFSTSTEIFRYPHFGYLTTFGEGNCRRSYSINGTEYNPYILPTIIPTSTSKSSTSSSSFSSTIYQTSSSSSSSSISSSSSSSSSSTFSTSSSSSISSTSSTSINSNSENSNIEFTPYPASSTTSMGSTVSTTTTTTSSSSNEPTSTSSTTSTVSTTTNKPTTDNYNSFESSVEIFNNNNKFIGCYNDEIVHDLAFNEIFSINMTNEKCESYCTKNGFKYSGTELGTQCYCGNSYGLYGKSSKQSDCNFKCGGDKNEICGGNDKISVYKTSYNGCFSYEPLISHFSISANSPTMTVKSCRAYCYSKTYLIAGLSRGNICFCGNDTIIEPSSSSSNSNSTNSNPECNIKCLGSSKENCGGVNEISIYSTQNLSNILVPSDFNDTTSSLNNHNESSNSSSSIQSLLNYLLLTIVTLSSSSILLF